VFVITVCCCFVQQTGISFEERGNGTVLLAPPASINTAAPHSPKNQTVLGIMRKFQVCTSSAERQLYIASLLASPSVGNPTSSADSNIDETVFTVEDRPNADVETTVMATPAGLTDNSPVDKAANEVD
jgi:hypothetical protein